MGKTEVVDNVGTKDADPFDVKLVILICLVGLVLRLIYCFQSLDNPFNYVPILDEKFYIEQGRYLSQVSWAGTELTYYTAPLFSYLVGLILSITGSLFFVRVFVVFCDVASIYLIYSIGVLLWDKRIGCLAALLYAFYGPALFYSTLILKTVPTSMLLLLYTRYLLGVVTKASLARDWFFLGLLAGVGALIRSNLLLLLFVTPLIVGWRLRERSFRPIFMLMFGGALLVFVLASAGKLLNNNFHILSANGGIVAYIANNPDNSGGDHSPPTFVNSNDSVGVVADFQREAERREGHSFSIKEASDYWGKETIRYVIQSPLMAASAISDRFLQLISNEELGQNYSYEESKAFSPLLDVLSPGFGLVMCLGVAGFFRRAKPEAIYLWVPVMSVVITCLLFFSYSRFRFPLVPYLFLGASCLLINCREYFQKKSTVVLAIFISVLLMISISRKVPQNIKILARFNVGVAHIKLGQLEEARAVLRDRLGSLEKGGLYYYLSGLLNQVEGSDDRALDAYSKAVSHGLHRADLFLNVGRIHFENEDFSRALTNFRIAYSIKPGAELAIKLAKSYVAQGDREKARDACRAIDSLPAIDPGKRRDLSGLCSSALE